MSKPTDNGFDPPSAASDERARVDLLYREHAAGLRRRLRARLGSTEEANELLHDAFARLLGARPLNRVREPGAFLNRIVRNLLVDRSRRRSARPAHVSIGREHDPAIPPEQGQQIEYEQMRDRYREAIASLPPRMRQVFIMHRLEGLSYRQIAERLDISVRTVEWHVAEAIIRVSRRLNFE